MDCIIHWVRKTRNLAFELHFYAYMCELGLEVLFGNSLVSLFMESGRIFHGQQVFLRLPYPDETSWSSLITGYVETGDFKHALTLYALMQDGCCDSLHPNARAFVALLKACTALKDLEGGQNIHAQIDRNVSLKADDFISSALINMYVKCGSIVKAEEVFETVLVRNVVSWNILIAGYAQGGELGEVLYILEGMKGEGIKPSPVTFISVLNACSHVGLVDKGETYFEAMAQSYGVTPTLEHQSCLVDILGRAGQLENVAFVMNITPSLPNTVMWLTMLSACRKWGDVRLGRNAFEQVVSMDGNNSASYMCMHKLYAGASMEE